MKLTAVLVFLIFLVGCGGTAASPVGSTSTSAPAPAGSTTAPATPAMVTVSVGQTAGSVDITVSAIASSPAPNAQDLGAADVTGKGSAFNTGDVIHRGQTARVLLFGPGLSADMSVTIRGPSDIMFSDIVGITSTNNTPGVSFTAVVTPNAALGARTVVLQNSKGDITTFTGGLEVVP